MFDVVMSERVFQHLSDPGGALVEMVRVCRPGGAVLVADTDWGTLAIDVEDEGVARIAEKILKTLKHSVRNGESGRQLRRLAKRSGGLIDVEPEVLPTCHCSYEELRRVACFLDVERSAVEAGVTTVEEIQKLRHYLERADASGELFAMSMSVVLTARKASC